MTAWKWSWLFDALYTITTHPHTTHTHTHTHTQCQSSGRMVQNHLHTSQCSRASLLCQLLPSNHWWTPYSLLLPIIIFLWLLSSSSSAGFRPALVCLERLRDNPPCQPVQLPHEYYQYTDAFLATDDSWFQLMPITKLAEICVYMNVLCLYVYIQLDYDTWIIIFL